jgi:hypothetical protein
MLGMWIPGTSLTATTTTQSALSQHHNDFAFTVLFVVFVFTMHLMALALCRQ